MSQQALSWAAARLFRRAAQRLQSLPGAPAAEHACLWQCHQAALNIGASRVCGAALPAGSAAFSGLSYPHGKLQSCTSRGFKTSAGTFAQDYYELLGVPKTATDAELKKAYYQLAKKYHPDANPGDVGAAKKFQEVTQAYDTLRDPGKRQIYDQVGPEGMQQDGTGGFGSPFGQGGFSFRQGAGGFSFSSGRAEDVFGSFFGGGGFSEVFEELTRQQQRRGADLQMRLEISFMEAAKGGRKSFSYGGSNVRGRWIPRKTVDVDIPAGVDTGTVLQLPDHGLPPEAKGGSHGSMMLEVQVAPHPIFRRDGFTVHQDLDVDFVDLILGTSMRVPTLDQDVSVTLRPGTQDGERIRLTGHGIQRQSRGPMGGRGDMIVHVKVVLPRRVTERQRQLLLDFAEEERLRRAA